MTDLIAQLLQPDNFAQAWQRVARNKGCPGVDQETIAKFATNCDRNLNKLRYQVASGTYRPLPLRQIFIPKQKGWRELRVPTVRDRITQQAVLNILHPVLEPEFEPCSFGYRPGRSHRMAAQQVATWHQQGYDWVLDADILKYFDHVHHQRLLAEVAERLPGGQPLPRSGFTSIDSAWLQPDLPFEVTQLLDLIEAWISVGTLTKKGLMLPSQGIPQGAVVSPILANVYLDDFDEVLLATELKLVRYADDFLVLGRSQAQIETVHAEIGQLMAAMGLQLHPEKTQITNFERGFRFLGQIFVGDLVLPVKQAITFKRRIAKQEPLDLLIHSDSVPTISPMEQALVAALKEKQQPIPPPLYVVLGYKVREKQPVKIQSQEIVWRAGMSTLYLVDQNATLQKEQGRFIIKVTGQPHTEVLIRDVERILVFGNIQLTTAAISTCLSLHIPVIFLSQLGDYKGHLWSAELCDLKAEATQFQYQNDEAFQLQTAQAIVRGKLLNSKQLLLRLNRKRKHEAVAETIAGLKQNLKAINTAATVDQLRGYEGTAAARYFPALGHLLLNPEYHFRHRHRRPPTDPINSLLSFGYTLLYNNVLSMILAEGLNPYLGNLHSSARNETHLAFDLMEEFRSPIVDSLVLTVTNRQVITPSDFTWPNLEGGIYLTDEAKRVFLKAFEERLGETTTHPDVKTKVSYRRVIQLQVQRYKLNLLDGTPYAPYLRPV